MRNQFSIPLRVTSPANWLGVPKSTSEGSLSLGTGRGAAFFVGQSPSFNPPQIFHWPWKTASEIVSGSTGKHPEVPPQSVSRSYLLDLLATERTLASALQDQKCAPQCGTESTNSTQDQPAEINLGEGAIIKKLVGRTILGVTREKDSTSNRIPKAIELTLKVVMSGVSLSHKNTKSEHGIGSFIYQCAARIQVEQPFDLNLIGVFSTQFGVIEGFEVVSSEIKFHQNFCAQFVNIHHNFELSTLLSAGSTRFTCSIKCRLNGSRSAQSDTQNAAGYPTNRTLIRSVSLTNHMPIGHPDEVPRENFLADATTISAQSRAKARCPEHLQQTQTPTKTKP